MQKAYDHNSNEDKLYAEWEDSGYMRADANSDKPPFTIPLPPPNVTGQLHLGHAAMLAIEDIMIRYKRMTGHETLWIPGTDHAAIATENVVLKKLGKSSREEFTREDFLAECRKFAQASHDTIVNQTKKMGAWLDWSREAYTFDEDRSHAVNTIFKSLYDDGLIERGFRMINWSVGAQSVLADDEVEWEERTETLYHIQCGEFVISTVRPETKCADSAMVVNPHDPRYKDMIGTEFEYETYAGVRKFHIIGDDHVDPEFGSGAMTISTAHDANDYAIAKRHDLPFITKIGFDGRMTDVAGPCAGMTVAEARKKSVEIMKEKGLIVKEEVYTHSVPLCYRTGTVVEPMLSAQWFISVEKEFTDKHTGETTTLKKLTQQAVRDGHVNIIPKRFEKIYFQWIDNLRDWCISRQIWWGHRIPIWYDESGNEYTEPGPGRTQDEDTLDTWFSSALWPFSTLGWPDESAADFNKFYPNDVLETGHDILFFWVARMIMFGRYITGKYPFHTVYLHGLVCDEKGKKMSKSKGNGIDPLEVIADYGADAVRLSLVIGTTPGNNIPIGKDKIAGYRNFVNKVWNATRFVQFKITDEQNLVPTLTPTTLADRWILTRLRQVAQNIGENLESYQISHAGDTVYHFVWGEFCDWYIEAAKAGTSPAFLLGVMLEVLKVLHPLCPFISEKCQKELLGEDAQMLILQDFPSIEFNDEKSLSTFKVVQDIIAEIRKIRRDQNINPKEKLTVQIGTTEHTDDLQEAIPVLQTMANLGDVIVAQNITRPEHCAVAIIDGVEIIVEVPFDPEAEKARLEKDVAALQKSIGNLKGRLSNKSYTEKAPEHLVNQTRQELELAEAKYEKLKAELEAL